MPKKNKEIIRKKTRGMTRSQKKRYKNQLLALARGQHKLAKKINRVAKSYAIIFTTQPSKNKAVLNRLGFCPDCKMNYCFNFSGTISWCHECVYDKSCLKLHYPEDALLPQEETIIRQCTPCRWKAREKSEFEQAILKQILQ